MKKPNLSKKDITWTAGMAIVGAAAGLAISKVTTKKEEVTATELEAAPSEDPLDEVAADIDPEEGSSFTFEGATCEDPLEDIDPAGPAPEGAFVPLEHIHEDPDLTEI